MIRKLLRRFRDSITGRFVRKQYADDNPSTTTSERIDAAELADRLKREAGVGEYR